MSSRLRAYAMRISAGPGVAFEVLTHQRLGAAATWIHQLQGQQRRAFATRVPAPARVLLPRSAPRQLAGGQPHAADGRPGGSAGRRSCQVVRQGLLAPRRPPASCRLPARIGAAARRSPAAARAAAASAQFGAQRLHGFGDAVQRDQDLQHVAVGLARGGQRLAPGLRGLQRGVTGARLQRDVDGPLVQLRRRWSCGRRRGSAQSRPPVRRRGR